MSNSTAGSTTDSHHDYDIVIIGSGAGGGTVAKELSALCANGIRIALLEWGNEFKAEDNSRQELEMAKKHYFSQGGFTTTSQDLTLAFAKSLGGTTNVYTGTSLKMHAQHIRDWQLPEFTPEELEPRYQKYITENNVHLLPENEINRNNLLFKQSCSRLGWHVDQFPINVRNCQGLATCNLGCRSSAKMGTAQVQIPAAKKNGVDIFTGCRVDRLATHTVFATALPSPSSAQRLKPGPHTFKAKKIVLAAGAIHTVALLTKSFGTSLGAALGRYFTCHPALVVAGKHKENLNSMGGHPKSFYSEQYFDSDQVLLETCMYYPFVFSKSLSGYGPELVDFIHEYEKLQMILVLGIDKALPENRIWVDRSGTPQVDYRFTPELKKSLVTGAQKSAEILFESGAAKVHAHLSETFSISQNQRDQIQNLISERHFKLGKISISAAHLMGGARMGTDPKTSVTDTWGKVHSQKGLYVADASLFPDSAGVNPYLTIMALADRVAEGIKREFT